MYDICAQFIEWLDKHDFTYSVESVPVSKGLNEFFVYVNVPGSGYFRISEFDQPKWYVRETRLCYKVTPFEVCDKLLEEKHYGRKLETRRLRELVRNLRSQGSGGV